MFGTINEFLSNQNLAYLVHTPVQIFAKSYNLEDFNASNSENVFVVTHSGVKQSFKVDPNGKNLEVYFSRNGIDKMISVQELFNFIQKKAIAWTFV